MPRTPDLRLSRRKFLAGLALAAGSSRLLRPRRAWGGEVDWLAEVQRPPAKLDPGPAPRMAALLRDAGGQPITTLDAWKAQRRKIEAAWLEFLGPMPPRPTEIKFEVLREDQTEGCLRQLVRYETEPEIVTEAYILRPVPASEKPRAGVVALHPTSNKSIDEIAGVDGSEAGHLGLQLCRRGFVVVCPRCFLWQTPPGYRIDVNETVAEFQRRHPKTVGMRKMLHDAQRAVDLLVSLPEVDPARIGATGHSLGAKETLYLAAFDERIRAAVASEGGIGFSSTNWHDAWYLGPGISAADFPLNHHQLLALTAPRAFLILGGEKGAGAADGDRSWPYVEAALPVYKLYGDMARLGLYNHGQGHSIPALALERLTSWLETYLGAA